MAHFFLNYPSTKVNVTDLTNSSLPFTRGVTYATGALNTPLQTRLTMSYPAICRCAPFIAYMFFIALDQGLRSLMAKGMVHLSETSLLYLYPVKGVAVSLLLILFLKNYDELRFSDWKNIPSPKRSASAHLGQLRAPPRQRDMIPIGYRIPSREICSSFPDWPERR
jgi:hypothetical protein